MQALLHVKLSISYKNKNKVCNPYNFNYSAWRHNKLRDSQTENCSLKPAYSILHFSTSTIQWMDCTVKLKWSQCPILVAHSNFKVLIHSIVWMYQQLLPSSDPVAVLQLLETFPTCSQNITHKSGLTVIKKIRTLFKTK